MAQSGVKAKHACLFSASAVIGIVDAPIDGASLGAYGRRLANPLTRDLHAATRDRGKIPEAKLATTTALPVKRNRGEPGHTLPVIRLGKWLRSQVEGAC